MTPLERPPADARARLLAAAAQTPATKPGSWRFRVLWGAAIAAIWIVVMQIALGMRHDWRELPAGPLTTTVVALAGFAVVATTAALARGGTMAGATTERLLATAVGLPFALCVLIAFVDPRGPSTLASAAAAHAIPCDMCVFVVALPLVGLGLWIARGLTLARPALAGACVGLGAATWGHLVIRLHCPVGGAGHALLGHLAPALPLMVIGAWAMWHLGRRSGAVAKNSL